MNVLELFAPIRTFVFDIDGVMTDGSLLVTETGDLLRSMNIRDGYATELAVKKGYNVWVISGGKQEAPCGILKRRCTDCGYVKYHGSTCGTDEP